MKDSILSIGERLPEANHCLIALRTAAMTAHVKAEIEEAEPGRHLTPPTSGSGKMR